MIQSPLASLIYNFLLWRQFQLLFTKVNGEFCTTCQLSWSSAVFPNYQHYGSSCSLIGWVVSRCGRPRIFDWGASIQISNWVLKTNPWILGGGHKIFYEFLKLSQNFYYDFKSGPKSIRCDRPRKDALRSTPGSDLVTSIFHKVDIFCTLVLRSSICLELLRQPLISNS